MRTIITITIIIAVLYGFSKLTGIQMGGVVTVALGLFLLMGVCVDIHDWWVRRTSPRWHSGGEPGSGMDDGE